MIQDREGNKVTAQVLAKIVLKEWLDEFKLEDHELFEHLKRTEPDKVNAFVAKLKERMAKALVIKGA